MFFPHVHTHLWTLFIDLMKKLAFLTVLLFSFLLPQSSFGQFWVSKSAVPDSAFILEQYKRHENGSIYAEIDGNRYAIMLGGRSGAGKNDSKRPVLYNFDTNMMSMGENADDQYHHFQAAVWRDSIIVVGMSFDNGYPNEVPQTELWLYYIKSETWVLASTVPVDRMRGSAQCVVLNDTAYFFNGLTNGHISGWVNWSDKYDLANGVWDTLAPSPHPRDHSFAILDGTSVYLAGGRRSAFGNGGLSTFPVLEIDVYDIPTDTWSTLPVSANLPGTRAGHQAAMQVNTAGHKQLNIWGGEIAGAALITGIGLDLTLLTWNTLPDLEIETHGTAIVPINGDTLVMISGRDYADEHLVSDSFYVQVYYGTPTLLPLDWMHTEIVRDDAGILQLSWNIFAPENGTFVIQQMEAGGKWREIGKVGADSEKAFYSWRYEESNASTKGIFRVHLTMQDGTHSFSPSIEVGPRYQLADIQNPITRSSRQIRFLYGQTESASIYTLQGQLMASIQTPVSWDVPENLAAGRYLLKVKGINGEVQSYKLILE